MPVFMLRRFLLGLMTLCAALVFTGCPHHIEKLVDETIPPENYDPGYLKSSLDLAELTETYRDSAAGAVSGSMGRPGFDRDTIAGATDGVMTGVRIGPIKMDIRSVDDSRYPDRVELHAFVFDTAGNYVSGLAPPKFDGTGDWRDYWHTLVDSCGGRAVEIENYTVEEVSEENRQPYSLAFVFDQSASMGERRVRILRKAIALLLRGISKKDNVSIVSFTHLPFIEVPLTGDKRKWVTSFDSADLTTYGGGTAIYDAALQGIEEVSRGPGDAKRVLIIFTDGIDGNSKAKLDDVSRAAREKNVSLYTIAYGPADKDVLHNLAFYTGGRMYRIYRSQEFLDVFIDIYRRLNRFYRITYRAPECAGIHTARAFLSLPELGIAGLWGQGQYDRSVITPFDSVGSIVFVNIEFDYNEATIRPESMPRIREVADAMLRNPDMRLEVRGHTDDQGSDEYNLKLSERRAEAVGDALYSMGISKLRLIVKGFGETRPLAPNDSDENRRRNRRTEFVILAK